MREDGVKRFGPASKYGPGKFKATRRVLTVSETFGEQPCAAKKRRLEDGEHSRPGQQGRSAKPEAAVSAAASEGSKIRHIVNQSTAEAMDCVYFMKRWDEYKTKADTVAAGTADGQLISEFDAMTQAMPQP